MAFFGSGKEDVVGFDVRVEAELLEFGEEPLGIVLVVGRADIVRTGGETLHVVAHVVRAGDDAKFFFPMALGVGGFGGKAIERRVIGGCRGGEGEPGDSGAHYTRTHNKFIQNSHFASHDSRRRLLTEWWEVASSVDRAKLG